ncbi:MAG: hypothetical protein ACE5M4_14545 [Anaerolineales bacterium]
MGNLIGGVIAVALIVLFLGGYAVGIASIPFSIIVVAILIMVVVDFVQSVRGKRNGTGR